MDIVGNLLFWLHLAALALGGAAAFAIPVVGSKMGTADVVSRPLLFTIVEQLSMVGRTAFGILIITGPLLVWLKFGGMSGFSVWFTVKMVFVVVLLVSTTTSSVFAKRAQRGDGAAIAWLPRLGMINILSFLVIILAAVLAFN